MRLWQLLVVFLLPAASLTGLSIEDRARAAGVYAEAHQYTKAIELYRALLGEELAPWQRGIVQYNIGVLFLQQQRWEEALRAFDEVAISDDSSPLLLRRYYYDLAVAMVGYARSEKELFSVEDPSFIDRVRAVKSVLARADQALNLADDADCNLRKIEGAGTCEEPLDGQLARQWIRALNASLIDEQQEYEIAQMATNLKVARLIVIVDQGLLWLGQAQLFPDGREFLPLEAERMRLASPLWDSLSQDALSEKGLQLLKLAHTAFTAALVATEAAETAAANRSLREASYWLRGLLGLDAGENVDALLKVRILADQLEEPSKALDALAQQWLQQEMPALSAKSPAIAKKIQANWNHPLRTLLLYYMAQGRTGALIATVVDDPKAISELLPLASLLSGPNTKALLAALEGHPPQQPLMNLAASLDPLGFLQESLEQLTVRYDLALAHRNLSLPAFDSLTTPVGQINHFIQLPEVAKIAGVVLPIFSETLGLAMKQHNLGVAALKARMPNVARIFLDQTRYWLEEAHTRSVQQHRTSPEYYLSLAIDEQRQAMDLVSAVMELPADQRQALSPFAKDLHEAMRTAQKQPMIWAAPFISSVLRFQREAFAGKLPTVRSCQRRPWDEVLPLYFLGETASDRATQNLAQAKTSLTEVLNDQRDAYKRWLKAMDILREKAKAAQKAGAEKRQEPIPGAPITNPSTEDTLRLLQQMDREDRPEPSKTQPEQVQGEKPW